MEIKINQGQHKSTLQSYISRGKRQNLKIFLHVQNNGPNALHGGLQGLDKVMWNAFSNQEDGTVVFSYLSKDGDEGYPGGEAAQTKHLVVFFQPNVHNYSRVLFRCGLQCKV